MEVKFDRFVAFLTTGREPLISLRYHRLQDKFAFHRSLLLIPVLQKLQLYSFVQFPQLILHYFEENIQQKKKLTREGYAEVEKDFFWCFCQLQHGAVLPAGSCSVRRRASLFPHSCRCFRFLRLPAVCYFRVTKLPILYILCRITSYKTIFLLLFLVSSDYCKNALLVVQLPLGADQSVHSDCMISPFYPFL